MGICVYLQSWFIYLRIYDWLRTFEVYHISNTAAPFKIPIPHAVRVIRPATWRGECFSVAPDRPCRGGLVSVRRTHPNSPSRLVGFMIFKDFSSKWGALIAKWGP